MGITVARIEWQSDLIKQLKDSPFRLWPCKAERQDPLLQDVVNPHARVKGCIRILKHDLEVGATSAQRIATQQIETNALKCNLPARFMQQLQYRLAGGCFATP